MVNIFVSTAGRARVNPVTREVLLDFESKELDEVTIQLPLANLQLLAQLATEQIGSSVQTPSTETDPLPLGGMYRTTAHVVSRTQSGVRLAIHLESASGARFLNLDLSPQGASALADDLYEKARPL